MNIKNIESKTYELIEDYLESLGYEVVFVEFLTEQKGRVLRIYIDKENGVNIDDCVKVNDLISPILDVENFIKSSYNLEITSPGLNRPLRKKEHFCKVIGEKIKVILKEPIEENRKNFKGILIKVNDTSIILSLDNKEFDIPFKNIKKANLIYNFNN